MTRRFDALIIGAGQAGPALAARLTRAGKTVALFERRGLGGACVNDGCIPTKTLVASARVAHLARRAADFGVVAGPVSVDMAAVKARKDAVVAHSIGNLTGWLEGMAGLTLVFGDARFNGPRTVNVDGEIFEGEKVFINVGGRSFTPDWPGLSDVPYLTNSTMMQVDFLPEHLIVAGGSYIGLEFAQMYRRFGSKVTVLEYADRVVSREDVEVSQTLTTLLEAEGLVVRTGVRDIAVSSNRDGQVRLDFRIDGKSTHVEGSHLLLAVGRRPNTDGLGLESAGVATDARGFITVDDHLRTSAEGIWALGDVHGRGAFTHTSWNDYEIVAANLLDGQDRRITDRVPAYALFTDPPLGRVGMSEAEARASGRPVLVATYPMSRVGRAKERGETGGFMKILVDAGTDRILGASLLCIEGDEIVHSLLNLMAADAPVEVLRQITPIHPTVSELIPTLVSHLRPLE